MSCRYRRSSYSRPAGGSLKTCHTPFTAFFLDYLQKKNLHSEFLLWAGPKTVEFLQLRWDRQNRWEPSPEAELVHGHGQVSGLAEAPVGVTVVHGDQVDVAKDKAVIVVLLQGLHVADVQQLGSVKGLVSILRTTHSIN